MTNLSVRLISDIVQVEREWKELLNDSDTGMVFQSPAWMRLWTNTQVLGVYNGNELVGVGVFEKGDNTIIFGGMRPGWGGAYALADFGDITAQRHKEKEIWMALFKFFNSQFTNCQLQLDFVREDSPSFMALPQAAKELGLKILVEEQEVSPYIALPRSWDEYVLRLPRKKRHELRRKMKQIERLRADFLVEEGISDDRINRFVELVKLSSSQKHDFMTREMENFFQTMMTELFAAGLGKLFILEVGGVAEAMVLGFEWKSRWLLYNGGYNPDIKSVGVALAGRIIGQAMKSKIGVVDFLRGDERYKYDLGAVDQNLYKLTIDN